MKKIKIAIVHDYIKEYGGAERFLESLHDTFPDAPVYTTIYDSKYLGPHKDRFKSWDIRPSFLQYIPFHSKLISPFRLISPLVFKTMDFSEFDIVIVSATGAYLPNTIRKQNAKQICYCHTPPRYLYGFETARKINNKILKFASLIAFHFMRLIDFHSAQNVDQFIANSEEVKKRIWKFYRKESVVINPPVNTGDSSKFLVHRKKDYYVAGGRLARAKHQDLAIKSAIDLNINLKVFGKSFTDYGRILNELAAGHSNIELLGEIDDNKKSEIISGAKAFISPSRDEDFGMLNVESMALGTPVIAHASGGALETIIDNKTGVLFKNMNKKSLINAVQKVEKLNLKSSDCKKQAEKFSEEKFKEKIKKLIFS